MSKLTVAVLVLGLLGSVACEEENCICSPSGDPVPPISILSVEVVDWYIHAILMLPDPDQIEGRVTLRIENKSSTYSYSGLSIPTAKVYSSATNQLLGQISFETDWDGDLAAGDTDTVVLDKIVEDAQIFPYPCGDDVYLELEITTTNHGEMQRRTTTYNFSCLI